MEQRGERMPEVNRRVSVIDEGLFSLSVAMQAIINKYPNAFPEAQARMEKTGEQVVASQFSDTQAPVPQPDQLSELAKAKQQVMSAYEEAA